MNSSHNAAAGGCGLALILALAQAAYAAPFAEARRALPEIGDPSYSALSLADEKKLGNVILAQVRASLPVNDDIEVQEYLQAIGSRLLSQAGGNRLDFHFLPVADAAINAFATPGGVVAINDGLVLFADDESELAAVLAHEIAHVSRRHIARLNVELQTANWLSALVMIAGLMAGAYNPDLAQLATFAGAALPTDQRLRYTRGFEREADAAAMRLMAAASLDPGGVARFFSKLQAREGRRQVPEFLRTHPLTLERLRNAAARVADYPGNLQRDSREFRHVKARLRALHDAAPAPGETETASLRLYREGIALAQRGLAYEALQTLERIPQERRGLPVMLALGQAHVARGDYREARRLFAELNELHPRRASINYYLAVCLLKSGGAARAMEALELLRKTRRLHRYYPQLHKLSAQAAAVLKRGSLEHEHLANYYLLNGRLELALHQLQLAERAADAAPAARERIGDKRAEITALQQEMKRRL